MLYRIDYERFLTHAIDHFTYEELISMNYVIISCVVKNGGKFNQNQKPEHGTITKIMDLYPDPTVQEMYHQYRSKDMIRNAYFDQLKTEKYRLYNVFIQNFLNHVNIMIISSGDPQTGEPDFIDLLCEYLEKEFELPVINLNTLFTEGRIGPIYIDRDSISNNAVDIRREASREEYEMYEKTSNGRAALLERMNKKQKKKKLKELGINTNGYSEKEMTRLLIEGWVEEQ